MGERKGKSGFTEREQLFIAEFPKDLNATQAAIRAGYSKRSAGQIGHRLLKKDEIQQAIRDELDKHLSEADVTTERVVRELARIGFSNMLDYLSIGRNGEAYVDLSGLTRSQAAAISEYVVEDFVDGRGEDARDVRRVRFKTAPKHPALETLAKYLGILTDRHELTGEFTVTEIVDRIVDPSDPSADDGG